MSFKTKLALEASAGSGKTFALSVRYIALLLKGSNANSIVALTFTKKAANEMKVRVFETLQELQSEQKRGELKELCSLLDMDEDEVIRRRDEVLPNFLSASIKISTIDAFFGLILRKFSLHFGLMPDYTTDDRVAQAHLQERFVRNVKKEGVYDSLLHFATISERSLDNFFSYFEIIYQKDNELENLNFARTTYPSDEAVLEKVKEMREFLVRANASNTAIKMFEVEDIKSLLTKAFLKYEELNYSTFAKVYTEELGELYLELKEELRVYHEQKESYILGELFYLYALYKRAREDEAKNSSELAFDDVANIVYTLLHDHINSEFLYFRLDANIEHLLIDEFQDTNIVQYKILQPIIDELTSGIGTKEFRSFFYVGDIKQSIYRFRGGAKALFSYVAKEFKVDVDTLKYNYRSSLEVVDFVNKTFSQKIPNYEDQIPTKSGGYVSVTTTEELLEEVVLSVGSLLESGVKAEDIAILSRTNDDVQKTKDALEAAFPNLQTSVESTVRIVDSQKVEMILEFLKYIYFGDEIYGRNFQLLRGESYESLPTREGFSKGDSPLSLTLSCIERFELDAHDLDVLKFIEIVSMMGDLEELLFNLDKISQKSLKQDSGGLKLLTIHKSKGLEFQTVIVLDKLGRASNQADLLIFDYEEIVLNDILISMGKREFFDERYKEVRDKEKQLRDEDTLNQQYVAFTRAKKNLLIIKKEKSSYFDNLELQDIQIGVIVEEKREERQREVVKKEYKGLFFGKQDVSKKESTTQGNLNNIYFGLALHYTLEMMSEFTTQELENSLVFAKNRYGNLLDDEAFISIKRRVLAMLGDNEFKELMRGASLSKEQPFVFNEQRGQVDLMLEKEDEVIIIDYKSSPEVKNSDMEQVALYKKAFENITKKEVKAMLFYLHEDEVEKINL